MHRAREEVDEEAYEKGNLGGDDGAHEQHDKAE